MTARALLALALCAATAGAAAGEDAADVSFVPLTVNLGGDLLDTRFIDMNADGRTDMVLGVRARRAGEAVRREIHVHHLGADGLYRAEPDQVVPVHDDVIVYACADVRAEPGRELLFLTRSGAWSYSPTLDGYRDNIARLVTQDLLFQVPDDRALSSWSYVLERDPQDLLLLPGTTNLSLWGPATAGTDDAAGTPAPPGEYASRGGWGETGKAALFSTKAPGALIIASNGARVSIDSNEGRSLFIGEAPAAFSALLEADVRYRAPALADVNGDGLRDLVLRQDNALKIALGTPEGLTPDFVRTEPLPAFLLKEDTKLQLLLADIDRDGDTDVLARVSPDRKSLDAVAFTCFVLVNDGVRLLPAEAQQVLKLEASDMRMEVTDANNDGRPDLVLTKWTLPSLTELVTGFKLNRATFVYFADDGATPFERKPSLRDEQTWTLDSIEDALVLRFLKGDCSGDGVCDLVEVDLSGRVAIRRLQRDGGFFGSGDWSIEADPWKRFDMGTTLEKLLLEDLNGDGITDIVNPGDRSLMLMLSRRAGDTR